MKTILILLAIVVTSMCLGQASIFEIIPSNGGANSSYRAANGTSSHGSLRAHYIIPASELSSLPSGIDITSVAFNFLVGTNATANGNLKFYMENSTATSNIKSSTWSIAITGMQKVYDATFTIPNSGGAIDAPMALSDTFNYTGGGIHIAYEYIGSSFGSRKALYNCNNFISNSLFMTSNSTSTPGAVLGIASSYRPVLTVEYINPFSNDMIVDNLTLELGGHPNKLYDTNQTVTGIVRNKSSANLSYVPVTLTINGANPSVSTQNINFLPAGGSYPLTFTDLSIHASGFQTVELSVPSDQYNLNNSILLSQIISCDSLSYDDNTASYNNVGFNTGSGILAVKHKGSLTTNTKVKAIYAKIDGHTSITGNQLQAVLLGQGGIIMDTSAIITIAASQLGTKLVFPLTGNNVITPSNPDYYIGIRQYANSTAGYYPVECFLPAIVPSDRYYDFNIDGSGQSAPHSSQGTYGIGAIIEVERITLTNSDSDDSICGAKNITFTASGTSSDLYNFKSGGTSLQNTTSGTYTKTISSSTSLTVEGIHNNCPVFSDTSTISLVVVNASVSKTDDSTARASNSGANYQWYNCATGTAIAGATSQTYVASVTGNYMVVITQIGCTDTSICYPLIIPVAGINENQLKSLKVYPSPANNIVTVETDFIKITALNIRNIDGKIINSVTTNDKKIKLDVSNLPSGIYILDIYSEKGKEIKRFVKQ